MAPYFAASTLLTRDRGAGFVCSASLRFAPPLSSSAATTAPSASVPTPCRSRLAWAFAFEARGAHGVCFFTDVVAAFFVAAFFVASFFGVFFAAVDVDDSGGVNENGGGFSVSPRPSDVRVML